MTIERTLIGEVQQVPSGRPDGSDAFYVHLGNDEYAEIFYSTKKQKYDTPINTTIALSVIKNDDGTYTVSDVPRYYEKVTV